MSETVIKVENISKMYDLGLVGTGTLSKDLNRTWARLLGKPDPYATLAELNDRTQKSNSKSSSVWALKDINFEVKQGEVLGIIGKNGAGKSTLLKILSQITTPSSGEIKIKGRVASLLEVGTGMHPEMTARQNIYLNGSMMGMTRKEVTAKLDEIVDFAGIGKYIDTPIKRFSSGMTVRLGFAVAAFLEPEILIVDEVLAVGDAEFQKKAIGKMKDVSKGEGRTVLFVSHNMAAVRSLCQSGIVIEKGEIVHVSDAANAVAYYLAGQKSSHNKIVFDSEFYENEWFKLKEISFNATGKDIELPIDEYDEVIMNTKINIKKDFNELHLTYVLKNGEGIDLFTISNSDKIKLNHGDNVLKCHIPKGFLNIGSYSIDLYIIKNNKTTIFKESSIMNFNVIMGKRAVGAWSGREPGFIKPEFIWTNI